MSAIKETMQQLDVYIAGPMRGCVRNNFDNFHRVAKKWQAKSYVGIIHNPAKMDEDMGFTAEMGNFTAPHLASCMKRDLDAVFRSDAMVMLEGWERSEGARVEHALAIYLGLKIFYES